MQDRHHDFPILGAMRSEAEIVGERRAQIAGEIAEARAEKVRQLMLQRSAQHSPQWRIALWESLHGLALPRAAGHPLLTIIAEATDLTPEQVEAEQRRRSPGAGRP